jgi:hypothetical protein
MKLFMVLAVLVTGLTPAIAAAQAPTASAPTAAVLPSRDVAVTLGWLNGNKSEVSAEDSNDWYNHGLYGGAMAGWYWTDHHKTELEVGISNTTDHYTYRNLVIANIPTFQLSELTFQTKRVAIGQQYQFYRNAWFHPHLTAGADFIWETTTAHDSAITTFDQQARQTRELRPARDTGPDTTLRVRPYAEAGFKAYMTPKSFFRSDIRFTAYHGLDQVLLRFGFGVDF